MNQFQALLEANRVLSSTLDLSALLREVMTYATAVVGAETSSLLLHDDATGGLRFAVAVTDQEQTLKDLHLQPGEGIAGAAARDRTTQIVNDVSRDARWTRAADARTSFMTRSVLAVPLLYQGRLLGVVEAINKIDGLFGDDDARALEAFAAQAAIALENARNFERVNEEKNRLDALFNRMSDGAVLVDAAGRVTLANSTAERLLGLTGVRGMPAQGLFGGFATAPDLGTVLPSGGTIECRRRTGKRLFLEGTVTPVMDGAKHPAGAVIVLRDVTAERNESFLKASFLSLISHKLRTPLVTITGYCPLLLEDPTIPENVKKKIGSIQRQGASLAALVDKLLQVTMIDSETLSLEVAACRFEDVVVAAVADLEDYIIAQKAGVSLQSSLRTLPAVPMDKDKLVLVIKGVIENAIKFNTAVDKQVCVSGVQKDDAVGVEISDNGPGIPSEDRDRVFQKFYQVEEAFTGQVEGAGLGLVIAKHVVQKHGGAIAVSDSPGGGTTVTILIPSQGAMI